MRPHSPHQLGKRSYNIRSRLALLHDIIRPKMHRHDIRRVPRQPAIQLILVRNIDGQEPRVALVVAVVLCVAAVVFRLARPHKVDGLAGPFGHRLQLVPEHGAPADDFGDGVAEGHVAQRGGGVLGEAWGG